MNEIKLRKKTFGIMTSESYMTERIHEFITVSDEFSVGLLDDCVNSRATI